MDVVVHKVRYCKDMQLSYSVIRKIKIINVPHQFFQFCIAIHAIYLPVQENKKSGLHQFHFSGCPIIYTAVQKSVLNGTDCYTVSFAQSMLHFLSELFLVNTHPFCHFHHIPNSSDFCSFTRY